MDVAKLRVLILETLGDLPALSSSNLASIHFHHRDGTSKRPGHKALGGRINLGHREVSFLGLNTAPLREVEHVLPGNSVKLVLCCRRNELPPANHEKVGAVTSRNKALRIQHERLVYARLLCLDTSRDALVFRQRVDHRILRVGPCSSDERGDQLNAICLHILRDRLSLRDDHDRRHAQRRFRGLVRRQLFTPGHDQPYVNPGFHPIGDACLLDHCFELILGEIDGHGKGFGALVETGNVLVPEQKFRLVQSNSFPDAVPQNEARVQNRNLGQAPRYQ
mmetsp:Transcript_3310/g.9240  ORF Transcript_3310/g.9240 Transcript_3310/m.9240 type:complete len:278 (+) Transcript_3310:64-897(+)